MIRPTRSQDRGRIHCAKIGAKERFISYPSANRGTDTTVLLGWAGWNHAQQGLALGRIYTDRSAESFDPAQLTPIVAGIEELLPWIKQWHSGLDAELGLDLYEYLEGQVAGWSDAVGVARQDLSGWGPPPTTRGRRTGATTTRKTRSNSPKRTSTSEVQMVMESGQP